MPNVWHYSILVKTLVGGGRLDAAFRLFAQMKNDGLYIGQPIYSMLISGCAEKGLYEKSWEVFDSLVREGKEVVDEVTYTAMIHVCAKTQKVERAMLLLDEMYRNHLRPTDVTYNMIIYSCSSRVDTYHQGFDILNHMRTHGFVPDLTTYSCLLQGCGKAGDLANAYAVWTEMLSRGIQPNNRCYTSMMWTLANKRTFERRRGRLQAKISRYRERDDAKHLGTISSASKGSYDNEFEESMGSDVIEEVDLAMKEVQESTRRLEAEQRGVEANFLLEKDQVILAKKLFREMETNQVPVDPIFLRAFLAVFVNNDRHEEALHVVEHLYSRFGFRLEVSEYRSILQLCSSLGDFPLAQAYWFKMREVGLSPDASTYMYFVHTAAK